MGGGGTDAAAAVDREGQAVRFVGGLGLVAVDKVALLAGLHRRQHRAAKIGAAAAGVQRVPADVRHPLGAAVGVGVGDFHHAARDQPQALVQTELLRLVKQHLHSQADAQQRRTGSGFLADRLHQAQFFQPGHAILECAHAGKHQRVGGQHILRLARQQCLRAKMREGVLHAEQVGQAVVNNRHFHTRRTSTPPARMSSFNSCTVSFL